MRKRAPAKKQSVRSIAISLLTWAAVFALIYGLWASGFRMAIVRSGSMMPEYSVGDIMVTLGPSLKEPEVGDILISTPQLGDKQIPAIGHRAIDVQDGVFETQGDANENPDPWRVRPDDISGVVIGKIPLAWARSYLRSPMTLALIAAVIVFYLVWPKKPKTIKVRRKRKGAGEMPDPRTLRLMAEQQRAKRLGVPRFPGFGRRQAAQDHDAKDSVHNVPVESPTPPDEPTAQPPTSPDRPPTPPPPTPPPGVRDARPSSANSADSTGGPHSD